MKNNMDLKDIFKFTVFFLIGFILAGFIFNLNLTNSIEMPFYKFKSDSLIKTPHDLVKEDQIEVYPDKIVLNIGNASISKYASTGSMVPILNEYSNGIRIVPYSEDDIEIGDIITFERDDYLIVHRVIEIGNDENGKYFITKGDNNSVDDGKIRFSQIKYITIGVIW